MRSFESLSARIDNAPRWLTILATHAAFYGLYLATNRHPFRQPTELPFVSNEDSIPLIGWTAYLYLSILLIIPLTMCLVPKPGFGRMVVWGMAMVALHIAIFTVYPTIYPRPAGSSGNATIDLIWKADGPTNAFPSLHVAISFYMAFALARLGRRLVGLFLLVWAAAIAVSTLTVKQHYVLDSLAAIAIAFGASHLAKLSHRST